MWLLIDGNKLIEESIMNRRIRLFSRMRFYSETFDRRVFLYRGITRNLKNIVSSKIDSVDNLFWLRTVKSDSRFFFLFFSKRQTLFRETFNDGYNKSEIDSLNTRYSISFDIN